MVFVPGGTFRMGSDKHYPEEAPAHKVTVDGLDRPHAGDQPAVSRNSSRHEPRHLRGNSARSQELSRRVPHMLYAGSLVSRRRAVRSI